MKTIEVATTELNGKSASQVFRQCPRCKDKDLVHFEGDVICTCCGWDSIALSVEAQISAHCARYKAQQKGSQEYTARVRVPKLKITQTRPSRSVRQPDRHADPILFFNPSIQPLEKTKMQSRLKMFNRQVQRIYGSPVRTSTASISKTLIRVLKALVHESPEQAMTRTRLRAEIEDRYARCLFDRGGIR